MANAFTNFLGQVFNSPTQLKDYAHASRLYVDDYFRLAPKVGFLYYVRFNINTGLNNSIVAEFTSMKGSEIGLMVKNIDLPKFKIATEVVNQYNRKTVVQTRLDYQPVNITFHDDNNNTSISLWKAYYNYYYVDGKNVSGIEIPFSFKDTKYKGFDASITGSTEYGLNNKQTLPFFTSIDIYQLSRKNFTAFRLVNPMITEWSHDRLDQSETRLLENRMTAAYESVIYATGKIATDNPAGFATIHYDTTPGPLSVFGGGNNSLFGDGGIIPGINEVLGGSGDTSLAGLVKTGRGITNIVNNAKNISKASLISEGMGFLDKIARSPSALGALTGKSPAGVSLPTLPGENGGVASPAFGAGGLSSLGNVLGQVGNAVVEVGNKLGDTLKGLLPANLPKTSSALSEIKTEQISIASDLQARIASNQQIKDDIIPRLEIAKATNNQDEADLLYSQLDAASYTDPDKLVEQLNSVNANIELLDVKIAEAAAIETPTDTISVDKVELGISPEDVYDVGANPDVKKQINVVYSETIKNTSQYY